MHTYKRRTGRTRTVIYAPPLDGQKREKKNIITFWVFFVMANCLFAAAREWAKVAKKKREKKKIKEFFPSRT